MSLSALERVATRLIGRFGLDAAVEEVAVALEEALLEEVARVLEAMGRMVQDEEAHREVAETLADAVRLVRNPLLRSPDAWRGFLVLETTAAVLNGSARKAAPPDRQADLLWPLGVAVLLTAMRELAPEGAPPEGGRGAA